MAAKGNFLQDNDDILFHLNNRVDWDELFNLVTDEEKEAMSITTVEDYKSTWMEILSTFGEYSANQLEPNNQKVSREDLRLEAGEVVFPPAISENLKVFCEMGGPAISVAPKHGGVGGTTLFMMALQEMTGRACPSSTLNLAWFGGIAHILDMFASDEIKDEYIPLIADGTFSGSMALTEPDAGSDLASVRTYGEQMEDGTWKIYGSKQFISNGNGQVCLVLGKNAKGAKGLKSMNLYLVPRIANGEQNFTIAKLEEKPGLHGSATCALDFDGSVGYLLGKNGDGFLYMLKLMNEARIAVAFQGLGLLEATFRLARDFASQRIAFGKPIAEHELIAEKLLDMEVDLRAFRSLCYQAGYYASLVDMGEVRLRNTAPGEKEALSRKIKKTNKKLREWTPLVKYYCGEVAPRAARDTVQIHGGYGYNTEYKPEWWLRESLILGIYEGTSQIQALMCLKDTLKDIMRKPTLFAEIALGTHWKRFSEKDPLRRKIFKMRQILNSSLVSILLQLVKENVRGSYDTSQSQGILKLLQTLGRRIVNFENLSPALLHAERITEMKCIVAIARAAMWDAKLDPSRRWIAEHYITRKMPVMHQRKAEIEADYGVLKQRLNHEL